MKKKKTLIILISIIVFLLVSIIIGLNIFVNHMINKVEQFEQLSKEDANINEIEIVPEAHDVVNIMLVGADNLDLANNRISYKEERSDVLKVFSLDYTDKTIKLSSLDRDVVVWIPGDRQEFGHFNWAYAYGGPTLAIQTINYNLDLDITKYVTFSFAGFIEVIDQMDGIDIRLTVAEKDYFNKGNSMQKEVIEGDNHLYGKDALTYARTRYLDSDFERMDRQNTVIKAVISKLKKLKYSEILDLVNSFLPYINTNLTTDEIKNYLFDITGFDLKIETHTYPTYEENDVCVNLESLGGYLLRGYSNQVIDLHKFIYEVEDYKPSVELKQLEKKTYDTFGEFYEGSELLP